MIPKPPQKIEVPTKISVDIDEAARLLSVHRRTIERLIKKKELTPRYIGKKALISVEQLQNFVNNVGDTREKFYCADCDMYVVLDAHLRCERCGGEHVVTEHERRTETMARDTENRNRRD